MKEFRSKNSGRYIFNEDMHNLQELALSPVEMYKDSGLDFVLSGCVISITENNGTYTVGITSGYVFLDNRIRKVAAFSGTTSGVSTIGIYATTPTAPQITYRNGDTDYMYNDYEAEFRINYNNVGNIKNLQAIYSGNKYAFPNLRTAYFAHYALVNDGTVGHYPLIQGDRVVGTTGEFTNLKIGNNTISSLFVSRSGDTMKAGATLAFGSTIISETSIVVDGELQAESGTFNGDVTINGELTATAFIKKNGTANQFLKADGSVDTTNYATSSSLVNYLLLSGGTINGDLAVNENLQVNKNCIVSRDLTIQGQINAVGGTFTGNIDVLGLKASNAEVTNTIEVGGLNVNGIGNVGGTLEVGGAFTARSTANISGGVTSSRFIKVDGTSAQFLKADGSVDSNTYALASALNNYLLKAGGVVTGNLTCNAKITANSFAKSDGTATQFLKADGSIDANVYATVAQLSNYAQASSLSNYLLLTGGTLSGSITSPSFIKSGGTSSQFLKADGSVDSRSFLPLSGGTLSGQITAPSFVKNGGTSSQFLKADGTVDSHNYVPFSSNGGIEISEAKIEDELIVGISGYRTVISSDDGGCKFVGGNLGYDFDAEVNAPAFRKNGGLPSQFLKADGSIDSNVYATVSQLNNAISAGGTMYSDDYFLSLQGSGIVLGHLEGQATLALTPIDRNLGINAKGLDVNCETTISGSVIANSFIKSDGTSGQFLKADGSVDNNSYLPILANNTIEINRIIAVDQFIIGSVTYRTTVISDDTGCKFKGANFEYDFDKDIVAPAFVKENGTSAQFLKADGSVDSNRYVPFAGNKVVLDEVEIEDKLTLGYLDYLTTIVSDDTGCRFRGANLEYTFDRDITSEGSVTATSFQTSSDSRLKNKICNVSLTTEQIANAPAIKFTWNNEVENNDVSVGSIAQYWQNILPEVVSERKGFLTLNYGTAAMISVISLAKEVAELKKKIEKMKG